MAEMADTRAADNEKIFVVALDDDPSILRIIERILASNGWEVQTFSEFDDLWNNREVLDRCDAMVLDVDMPTLSGLEVLERVRNKYAELPVVMLTGDNSAETAVAALTGGAFNYILKTHLPTPNALLVPLSRAVAHRKLHRRLQTLESKVELADRFGSLVGASVPMRELFTVIERVAPLDVSILITGESGTGKELVARAIHQKSHRKDQPFVAINCGALPENLIDSDLFGHIKGAFTGAATDRAGAFERAHGGTVFLDEIGEMPQELQVRLLRVLQEREVMRLGASTAKKVDIRILAATLVNLEDAVARKEFREDLYYRLNVVQVSLPALRARMTDMPLLVAHLLHKHSSRLNRTVPSVSPEFQNALYRYEWPGNIRELENVLQGALAMSGDTLTPSSLPPRILEAKSKSDAASGARPKAKNTSSPDDLAWTEGLGLSESRERVMRAFEESYLRKVLTECQGNISEASRKAGLDRSNFKRALHRCAIDPAEFRTAV